MQGVKAANCEICNAGSIGFQMKKIACFFLDLVTNP